MSKTTPISVRLDSDLNEQVAAIASAMERPKSWVIERAVKDYVDVQAWHLEAIDEGIKTADAGAMVPHDDVTAWVRSWGTSDELPMPKCK